MMHNEAADNLSNALSHVEIGDESALILYEFNEVQLIQWRALSTNNHFRG
jgi:hypothetical protein